MEIINIKLDKYKSSKSTIFTGRPQGEAVRKEIGIDKYDRNKNIKVVFTLPKDTTSFNPSFYLGLLYKSYSYLGLDGFDSKYSFAFQTDDISTINVLKNNLEDGRRYAFNSLKPNSSFKSLFNKNN